jgi:hypothetical protein
MYKKLKSELDLTGVKLLFLFFFIFFFFYFRKKIKK